MHASSSQVLADLPRPSCSTATFRDQQIRMKQRINVLLVPNKHRKRLTTGAMINRTV
jgi:hypothetical protein